MFHFDCISGDKSSSLEQVVHYEPVAVIKSRISQVFSLVTSSLSFACEYLKLDCSFFHKVQHIRQGQQMTEAELQTLISKKNQTESPKIEKVGQILFSTVICENKQQLVLLVGYNEDGFLEIRRTSEQLLMESLKSFNLQQSGYIHRDLLLEMIQDANLKSFHFSSEKPKDLCNVTYIDDYEQLKTASLNISMFHFFEAAMQPQ